MISVKLPARGPMYFIGTVFPFLFAVLALIPLLSLFGHSAPAEPDWLPAATSAAGAAALAIYLAPSGYMQWAFVAVLAPGVGAAAIVGWGPVATAIVLGAAAGAAVGFLLRAMMLWALDQREAILAELRAGEEALQEPHKYSTRIPAPGAHPVNHGALANVDDLDADRVMEEFTAELLERFGVSTRNWLDENGKNLTAHMKRARARRQDEQRPEGGDEHE